MATPHDDRAKKILDVLLDDVGTLRTEYEVALLPAQRADVYFAPDPRCAAARRSLGLVGRMTEWACLIEAFAGAPDGRELRECLRKLLNHVHAAELKDGAPTAFASRAWLLCSGRPARAMHQCGARRAPGWPRGFYRLWSGLPVWLVALSELSPASVDTLPLRLMSTGATLGQGRAQLREQHPSVPRGYELLKLVVQLSREARGAEAEEAMVDLSYADAIEQRGIEKGIERGIEKGIEKGIETLLGALVRQAERRLARPPTDAERAGLRRRIDTDGAECVGDAILDLPAAELAAWLAAP